jgi:channel protein (hemolysin III family)
MLFAATTSPPDEGSGLYHLPGFYEPFSAVSHLFGAVFFVALGLVLLYRGRGNRARLGFLAVYAVSCVVLLSLSGVYHMLVRGSAAHQVMERLDHGAIFLLIAGTFTPVHGLLFRGILRWGPLLIIWGCAITGITLKTIFLADMSEWLGLSFYLALGWCGGMIAIVLARRYGFAFIKPALVGGLIYSFGATLDLLKWPVILPGLINAHELFHVTVLAGALCMWLFVWQFATGAVSARAMSHRGPAAAPEPAFEPHVRLADAPADG